MVIRVKSYSPKIFASVEAAYDQGGEIVLANVSQPRTLRIGLTLDLINLISSCNTEPSLSLLDIP